MYTSHVLTYFKARQNNHYPQSPKSFKTLLLNSFLPLILRKKGSYFDGKDKTLFRYC